MSAPNEIASSKARYGSLQTSNARCNVKCIPDVPCLSRFIRSKSIFPSGKRQPATTPSAPRLWNNLASSSMALNSASVYKKSPNLGRIKTCSGISHALRICLNMLMPGVVPPTAKLEHTSRRSAPPLLAITADSTESTQTSNILFTMPVPV